MLTCYCFPYCNFMEFLCEQKCVSLHLSVFFCAFSLTLSFCLFFWLLLCRLFSGEGEKAWVRWVGKRGEGGRCWGRGNYDQNIAYEKTLIFNNEKMGPKY